MEQNKIVKVYSNNSKKSRLKRRKNKFQRIWDAEKQTYVKVRKTKFPVRIKTKTEAKSVDQQVKDAIARQQRKDKAKKRAPKKVVSTVKAITPKEKPAAKNVAAKCPNTIKMFGHKLAWDSKVLRYKAA